MGLYKTDNLNQMITLTMITLSGFSCKNKEEFMYVFDHQNVFQAFPFNNGQHFYYIVQQNAPKPGKKLYFHN